LNLSQKNAAFPLVQGLPKLAVVPLVFRIRR